ncbi:MAG TPA: carboxypeptidase regulatory-like domain-containing protein [Acidobacteriaceae bacterium]|jgi:hypothetical protein|nr:carboxypeptidase regulatory-like domain-containing protein [Acidobacteriaceae bacterium]
MRTMHLAAVALILIMLCAAAAAERPGSVRGTVVDENGAPLAAAQVSVDELDGLPRVSPVLTAETDKKGHFSIANLEPGNYKVFAKKESMGYPDTSFAFYSGQVFTTVSVTNAAPEADTLLKIGPPAGVIKGRVQDAVAGVPVNATFVLRRTLDPDNWISTSQRADYRVLIPPLVEVSVEVSATGYKPWQHGSPIRLRPQEEMKLDIQLEPEPKPE